jgi:hypothetical protein
MTEKTWLETLNARCRGHKGVSRDLDRSSTLGMGFPDISR